MPLLLAVQFANPCSANYFRFVSLLLGMVGGAEAIPVFPFPFCGHCSATQRRELAKYVRTCQALLGRSGAEGSPEGALRGGPGDGGRAREWLAASFEKTLRLQLGE